MKHLVLIVVASLAVSQLAHAQYTFGPPQTSNTSETLVYDSTTGIFQYTDAENNANKDNAYVPLTSTGAALITATNGWTASISGSIAANAAAAPGVRSSIGIGILYTDGEKQYLVRLYLMQINNTDDSHSHLSDPYSHSYGTVVALDTAGNMGETGFISILPLTGLTLAPVSTESLDEAIGNLTFSYNAAANTLTGYYNGSFVGSYSLKAWGSHPPLTLVVFGSSRRTEVSLGTVTASEFSMSSLAPIVESGKYTLLLSSTDTSGTVPSGPGYATMTVSSKDGVVLAGKLADGESFSTSGLVSGTAENQFSFNSSLSYPSVTTRGTKGSLSGTLTFATVTGTSNLNGDVLWTKPEQTKGAYPAFFQTTLNIIGSVYQPPAASQRVLEFLNVEGNGEFIAQDGGSAESGTDIVTLSAANAIVPLPGGTDKLSLKVNTSNGTMTGSFVPPGAITPVSLNGVVFQIRNTASGFFLGGTASGSFIMGANPEFGGGTVGGGLNGDHKLPVVTITSPLANSKVSGTGQITFNGKASDAKGVTAVYYQLLYGDSIGSVQAASGTTNWSFAFSPSVDAGGIYTVYVKAVDVDGNESVPLARSLTYVVPSPLLVTISGKGTVSAGYGGPTGGTTQQDIGLIHSITANPGAGQVFTGWTGGIQSASRTLTFTMQPGLTLQGNFAP